MSTLGDFHEICRFCGYKLSENKFYGDLNIFKDLVLGDLWKCQMFCLILTCTFPVFDFFRNVVMLLKFRSSFVKIFLSNRRVKFPLLHIQQKHICKTPLIVKNISWIVKTRC